MRFGRVFAVLTVFLVAYLSLYTWNWRTGYLDRFSSVWGMEAVGWMLKPGKWVHEQSSLFVQRYIYLVGLRRENENLVRRVHELELKVSRYAEEAASAERLRHLLSMAVPENFTMVGARVVGARMGSTGFKETMLLDLGSIDGIPLDSPVVMPEGLLGRVIRLSPHFSTVLLVTDYTSHVAVYSQTDRTQGILSGQGPDALLSLEYVPLNEPLQAGDLLLTSGLGGVFPKGIPVARVTKISRSSLSLFLEVHAEPLLDPARVEEALILRRGPRFSGAVEP